MRTKARSRGFSMIEMVIVVSITMIVAAVAIPKFMQGIYDIRLRSAGTDLAGLMQQARQMAIKDNSFYPIKSLTQGGELLFYIDTSATRTSNSTANYSSDFPTVQMGSGVIKTFTNPDTAATSTPWGFSPLPMALKPYWGAVGLPCMISGGRCVTSIVSGAGNSTAGYQIILTDTRPMGSPSFISITASPGGRVRVWSWSGSVWR